MRAAATTARMKKPHLHCPFAVSWIAQRNLVDSHKVRRIRSLRKLAHLAYAVNNLRATAARVDCNVTDREHDNVPLRNASEDQRSCRTFTQAAETANLQPHQIEAPVVRTRYPGRRAARCWTSCLCNLRCRGEENGC